MSDIPLVEWDHALFSDLFTLLGRVAAQPVNPPLRRLQARLEDAKPWLLALTNVTGPNDADKTVVTNDPIALPNGSSVRITGDLANTVNAISGALQISHLLAAVLVIQSESLHSQYPARSTPEICVFIYHQYFTELLDFLHELLRLTISPTGMADYPFDVLREWALDLLLTRTSLGHGKGEGTIVDQILLQLDEQQRQIQELLRTNNPVGVEYEILSYRVGAIREQQNRMVGIMGLVTEAGYLGKGQVIKVLKWLKRCDRVDGLSGVLLATFLVVTQPIPADNPPEDNSRYDWCRDIRFLKLASSLIVQDQWTNTFLRDACKLSWFAFYRSAMQFDPIAANTGIDLPTTDNFFHEPIAGEIFQHLRDWVLRIRRERGLEEEDEDTREAVEDSLSKLAGRSDPRNDAFIFDQLQCLVDSLAGRKNFLKTLRNREEDALRSTKHHREEDIHAKLASRSTPGPLQYQAFMSFLAVVYRSLPEDRALHLWDDTTFTGIILDVRGNQYPGWAFWEMLTAISTGPECASIAYNKMNNETKLPWNKLFHFYQHFVDIMPKLLETVKPTRILLPAAMHPFQDVIPLRGWTRLLTTVIRHSKLARDTLLTSKPNPIQVLFDFINTDVAVDQDQRRNLVDLLDLKANVYRALTAFVTRKGDVNDEEIIQRAVENYERISFVDPSALFRSYEPTRISPVGWIAKMETLEQDAHIYPLTRAYLGFLTALIPKPNSSLDLPRPTSARLANTLRRGQAYVMDRVLLVPNVRRFGRETEQWEIIDSALAFVEKALLAYDPSELVSADLAATQFAQRAKSLADEPGFTVLVRFIGERNVFAILANILDTTSSLPLPRPSIVTSTLQRVLRVYHRIFDLQELLSVQMQILSEPRAEAGEFKRPIETSSLDQYLLNHLANVNTIALLVGDADSTVSYISTKLVCHLANSAVFSQSDIFGSEYTSSINRLAGIIDASDDSLRIAQGFCTRLRGQGEDLTSKAIEDVGEHVLRGEISSSSIEALPIAIRSTILDLLVEGTGGEGQGPNIAHFLLGFDFRTNDLPLQDPRSNECRPSALDSILTQLMEGSEAGGASTTSLFALHPVLAAKSVRLINQLFSNPLTGRSTISHALTHSGFSSGQLSSLPLHLPADNTDSSDKGIASTRHLGDYETSATNLIAFLEYRRWVLSCVALETFTFGGYSADAADIALTIFGSSTEAEADELDEDEQRLTLNDLLASVDIVWQEHATETTRELEYFNSFSVEKFKTAQWNYYDITSIERELRAQKRQYEQRGAVTAGNTTVAIEGEIKYILDRVQAVNRETEIAWAKGEFLSVWNECLKVSLLMLFRYVPEERQEVVLFELLDSLLDRCDADLAPGILENLSEAVLVSITTLVNILLEFDGQNLPVDRLSLILRKILDAVTRPGTTETSRGNLFAAISQYLQLLTSTTDVSDDLSTIGSTRDSSSPTRALQRATLREMSTKKDRFIPMLCRDAMDDRDVWKTECFALLGAVVSICQNEKDRAVLLPMTQMGALRFFVRELKDREISLQECLEPQAANLHAYWVFESKMACLMSIAASKKGAEDLLDAGIFEQLSMCSFVSVQPMREEIMGGSLQDSVDRQHRVLVCALQLLTRVLSSLHRSTRTGAGHAISFLNAHRESLLVILRENQAYLTLKGVEECKLIISMLAMVVHKVPSEDLRSSGGFGGYHLAVLAIAARFFDSQTWADITVPANEVASIESKVAGLNQVILAYLCATTQNLKSGTGLPVLLNGAARGQGPAKHIASAPSLQLAVDMLSDLADGVQDTASGYEAAIEREANGSVRTITGDEDSSASGLMAKSSLLFNMIESLLLLTWRHLLFYANDALHPKDPVRPVDISLSFSTHNRLDASRSSHASARQLEIVASGLRGVLERLDELNGDLSLDLRGKQGVGHGYYGMLVRRLKELCSALIGDQETVGEMDQD